MSIEWPDVVVYNSQDHIGVLVIDRAEMVGEKRVYVRFPHVADALARLTDSGTKVDRCVSAPEDESSVPQRHVELTGQQAHRSSGGSPPTLVGELADFCQRLRVRIDQSLPRRAGRQRAPPPRPSRCVPLKRLSIDHPCTTEPRRVEVTLLDQPTNLHSRDTQMFGGPLDTDLIHCGQSITNTLCR